MFGLWRRRRGAEPVRALHERVVAASRDPALYGPGGLPDTVEGRFESLTLHVLVVLRRLRRLPKPADDFAQDFIDVVFAHLEIALRELGVGDFGVPKRMKKLAGAFYDRVRVYDPALDGGDDAGLARAIAEHLPGLSPPVAAARLLLDADRALAGIGFDALLAGPPFRSAPAGGPAAAGGSAPAGGPAAAGGSAPAGGPVSAEWRESAA